MPTEDGTGRCLGNVDIKMTLRYARLAPENKLKAVELLDAKK